MIGSKDPRRKRAHKALAFSAGGSIAGTAPFLLFLVVASVLLLPGRTHAAPTSDSAADFSDEMMVPVISGGGRTPFAILAPPGNTSDSSVSYTPPAPARKAGFDIAKIDRANVPTGYTVAYGPIGGAVGCPYTVRVQVDGYAYDVQPDTGSSFFAVVTAACPLYNNRTGCHQPVNGSIDITPQQNTSYNSEYGTPSLPTSWTGNWVLSDASLPYSVSGARTTGGLQVSNFTYFGIFEANGFFSPVCPTYTGIWGLASGPYCSNTTCPILFQRLITNDVANGKVPNAYTMQFCGAGTDPSNTNNATNGGNFWLGGADSRFLAEQFSWIKLLDNSTVDSSGRDIAVSMPSVLVDGQIVATVNSNRKDYVILDSGTSTITMGSNLYNQAISAMKAANFIKFSNGTSQATKDTFWAGNPVFGACQGISYGNSTLSLNFATPNGSLVVLDVDSTALIRRERYDCPANSTAAKGGFLDCVAVRLEMMQSGYEDGITIIGTPFFQGKVLFFDFDNKRVGAADSIGCANSKFGQNLRHGKRATRCDRNQLSLYLSSFLPLGITPSAAGIDIFPGSAYTEPTITSTSVPQPVYPSFTCRPRVNVTATATATASISDAVTSTTGAAAATTNSKPSGARPRSVVRTWSIASLVVTAMIIFVS